MKLFILAQISSIESAWKDKWENKIKPSNSLRTETERACEREMKNFLAREEMQIENGHFGDCEGLENSASDVKCFAVCDEGLVGNWKKKIPEVFVRCKTENPEDLKFKTKSFPKDPLKCSEIVKSCPDSMQISKGSILSVSSSPTSTVYDVLCDAEEGSKGSVTCFEKNGKFKSSDLGKYWQDACSKISCKEEDANIEFPFADSGAQWKCKSKKGTASCTTGQKVDTSVKCTPTTGWQISKGSPSEITCDAPVTTLGPFVATSHQIPPLESCNAQAGFSSGKIIGGANAKSSDWPWFVSLGFKRVKGGSYSTLCGGSVLEKNTVITAAHCCRDEFSEVDAFFGDSKSTYLTGKVDVSEFKLTSTDFIAHPNHTGENNDWCLIKFTDSIESADADKIVSAPCLPSEVPAHGTQCWIAGFGKTSKNKPSKTLKSAGIYLLDQEYCRNNSVYETLHEDDICAGLPDFDGNGLTDADTGACHGDSGGPLICDVDGKATLVGVVNRSRGCAEEGAPTIYASIKHALSWIKDNVPSI